MGRGALHAPLAQWPEGPSRVHGGRYPRALRLHRLREDGRRVHDHGHIPPGHLMEFVRPTLGPGILPAAEWRGDATARRWWSPAGPWQGSIRGDGTGPCSLPSRTRPGTSSSSVVAGLCPMPRQASEPGDPGHRPGLAVGRHHQHRRLRHRDHRYQGPHARRPRLALTCSRDHRKCASLIDDTSVDNCVRQERIRSMCGRYSLGSQHSRA